MIVFTVSTKVGRNRRRRQRRIWNNSAVTTDQYYTEEENQGTSLASSYRQHVVQSHGDTSTANLSVGYRPSDDRSYFYEEERPPTFWKRMMHRLCPRSHEPHPRHREDSANTLASLDALSGEFEYVVEKLVIKRVPLSICGTVEDLEERYNQRFYLQNIYSEPSVSKHSSAPVPVHDYTSPTILEGVEQPEVDDKKSSVSFVSVYTTVSGNVLPVNIHDVPTHTETATVVTSAIKPYFDNRKIHEEDVLQTKILAVESTIKESNTHLSDISPQTSAVVEEKSESSEYIMHSYHLDSQPCEEDICSLHSVTAYATVHSPLSSRSKSLSQADKGNLQPRIQQYGICSKCGEAQGPLEVNDQDQNAVTSSSTAPVTTSNKPLRFLSTLTSTVSSKSITCTNEADVLDVNDKPPIAADVDEDEPVYVSVDGERVLKPSEEMTHSLLNQFSSIFVDNLKDSIPKDPLVKVRSGQQIQEKKSTRFLSENISEIGSTYFKPVPTGSAKKENVLNKSTDVTTQCEIPIISVKSKRNLSEKVTEGLKPSKVTYLASSINDSCSTSTPSEIHVNKSTHSRLKLGNQHYYEKAAPPTTSYVLLSETQRPKFPKEEPFREDNSSYVTKEIDATVGDVRDCPLIHSDKIKIRQQDIQIPVREVNTSNEIGCFLLNGSSSDVIYSGNNPPRVTDRSTEISCTQLEEPFKVYTRFKNVLIKDDKSSPATSERIERMHDYTALESMVPVHNKLSYTSVTYSAKNTWKPETESELAIQTEKNQTPEILRVNDPKENSPSAGDRAHGIQSMVPPNVSKLPSSGTGSVSTKVTQCSISDQTDSKTAVLDTTHNVYQIGYIPPTPFSAISPQTTITNERGKQKGNVSFQVPEIGEVSVITPVYHPSKEHGCGSLPSTVTCSSKSLLAKSEPASTSRTESSDRAAILRWKIIIKHRDIAEEQPPNKKSRELPVKSEVEDRHLRKGYSLSGSS